MEMTSFADFNTERWHWQFVENPNKKFLRDLDRLCFNTHIFFA
jgi:hypothetical protein